MNSSDTPSRITKAFGVNGLRNAIATDSSTATDSNGVATFDKGFPEVTMQPLSAGGIPPSGKDFNGVFYSTTLQQQWYNAGMTYPFSADFATAVSGYPKGAIVPSSTLTGQWLNLNESNGTSPESSTGASTGWVPINNYGITQITLSSSSVVLSSLQAAKDRIILSGTLTSNVNLIFPSWIKSWVVHNNCTGNFTVNCKTAAGSGVIVISGLVSRIFCDGINLTDETNTLNNDMVAMVSAFARSTPPEGWLLADGSPVSRVNYARLFSRIGSIYGAGDGLTTFNLPDLRGEFIRGFDSGKGVDPGRAFGTNQQQSVQSHSHDLLMAYSTEASGEKNTLGGSPNSDLIPIKDMSKAITFTGTGPVYLRSNSTTGVETRPRNLTLLYCIKY